MAKLYANENFPFPVVEELRKLGHDVLTIQETGKAELAVSDEEVLQYASEDDRCVLTINRRHFIALHKQSLEHGGIIVCTLDTDFAAQAQRIHRAIAGIAKLSGQLIRVNRQPS